MNSNYFYGLLRIFLSFIFGVLALLLTNAFYIEPFLTQPNKVTADPIGFMAFIVGASMGFFIIAFPNTLHRLIRDREIPVRVIYIWLASCGILATSANELLYQVVIKPNHMIECPLKLGYKKNLMRDYVLDASQCERF